MQKIADLQAHNVSHPQHYVSLQIGYFPHAETSETFAFTIKAQSLVIITAMLQLVNQYAHLLFVGLEFMISALFFSHAHILLLDEDSGLYLSLFQ